MSRKKYRDYKRDRLIRTPVFAWLLDRSIIYVALFVGVTLLVGGILKSGYNSFQRVVAQPEVVSPYLDISSQRSNGMQWAYDLIRHNPDNEGEWKVSDSQKPAHPIDASKCLHQDVVSASNLATFSASGDGVETRIQVYGAGQARSQFNTYAKAYKECFKDYELVEGTDNVVKFKNGFVFTLGDAIVSVTANDNSQRDTLLDFYLREAQSSLVSSGCVALTVTAGDSLRSFYYDEERYTGFLEDKVMETETNVDNLPVTELITLNEIAKVGNTKPESPLPAGFPELPDEVEKPVVPVPVNKVETFDKVATYQVEDNFGPGCGWEWSAQKMPVYNVDSLEKNKIAAIDEAQKLSNDEAQSYVDRVLQWALDMILVQPDADKWNKYVDNVNNVHDKWDWLNTERRILKPYWDEYIEHYRSWVTFDDRKEEAANAYDTALEECQSKQEELEDWENTWGEIYDAQQDAINNPPPPVIDDDGNVIPPEPVTPVEIPERPEGCTELPVKPSIIDQDKPDEPVAPSIPAGVTIPSSWDKPEN